MPEVGALGGDVQCKLVPPACVCALLAVCVSLRSRLSKGAVDLCLQSRENTNPTLLPMLYNCVLFSLLLLIKKCKLIKRKSL